MATFTSVQSNSAASSGSVTTLAVTLSSGATLGNLLVVCYVGGSSGFTVTGPDGSWARATPDQTDTGSNKFTDGLWFLVVDAAHAGLTSFTWTNSAAHTCCLVIREWNSSTGWLASPVDVATGSATSSSTTISTGTTAATTQPSELAVASLGWHWATGETDSGLTAGWTAGLFTNNSATGSSAIREAYQVLTATGTQSATDTISGSGEAVAGTIATFLPATVSLGAAPGRPVPRTAELRRRRPLPAWNIAVAAAAVPAGTLVFPPAITHPAPHRARLGAAGAVAAGILATGIGPPPVPAPYQPPVITHPAPHRAICRSRTGQPPNAAQQVKIPLTVWSRKPHGAAWRGIQGSVPAALPQPFRPVTVYRRTPHRAAWARQQGVPPAALPQPFRPKTIYARAPHRAIGGGVAGTVAVTVQGTGLPQPFTPKTIYSRRPHAGTWRSGRGVPPAAQPQPTRPLTVWARAAHRALWRVITGSPPPVAQATGAPQPFRPVTIWSRRPHGAVWKAARGQPPAAVRQPRTPATVFTRPPRRAIWRSGAGSPAPPPPPFTIGRLTASGASRSSLTASGAQAGALTASGASGATLSASGSPASALTAKTAAAALTATTAP